MQLRDYQQRAVESVWGSLRSLPGNPLLVMPTGSGKSPVIGSLCQTAIEKYRGRVLVLAHRKELLEQNADKIRAFLPATIPVGLYSAGLSCRNTDNAVICAGIQSAHKRAAEFGARQLVLVDEAHLVPDDGEGMYRKFLGALREINPNLRVVGLTATPFRTGTGSLTGPNKIFQHVCHEVGVKKLIDDQWLSSLVATAAKNTEDTSQLKIERGEFVFRDVEKLFDDDAKIILACREICEAIVGRRSVLVFCQGVQHARHVADTLERMIGEAVGLVIGTTLPVERAAALRMFREKRLRVLVNCDVLTTGFDAPNIDAICVLRATMSPGLFAQMVGRGLRLSPGKNDCLVLDFGENIARHGKLDDPQYGRKKKQANNNGDTPAKTCPNCEEELHAAASECECGFIFPPREIKHGSAAASDELLGHVTEAEWFNVRGVRYSRHSKKKNTEGKPDTLRVDYECVRVSGGNLVENISEWVCVEHNGYARKSASKWWFARFSVSLPDSIDEALEILNSIDEFREPVKLKAHREGHFWRIDDVELVLREPSFDFGGSENTGETEF